LSNWFGILCFFALCPNDPEKDRLDNRSFFALCPSDPKRDRSANRRRPSVMNLRVGGWNGDRET